jgi:hypothetical protein
MKTRSHPHRRADRSYNLFFDIKENSWSKEKNKQKSKNKSCTDDTNNNDTMMAINTTIPTNSKVQILHTNKLHSRTIHKANGDRNLKESHVLNDPHKRPIIHKRKAIN